MRMHFLVAAYTLLAVIASPLRADFVRDFDVKIHVNRDASMNVTETIIVVFESPRHGIYRFIPVEYERFNNRFTMPFFLDSITDKSGNRYPFSLKRQGADVNMKIGDKDVEIIGEHTYIIRYKVRRAVNFFNGAPEVYWNVTGDQWPYRIERATATLTLPEAASLTHVRTDSFVGAPDSRDRGMAMTQPAAIVFKTGRALPAGTGFTIVAGLPAGSVVEPTLMDEILWFIRDWWPVAVFPLLAMGVVLFAWTRSGRDEGAGQQAVAVEFEPPRDLSPTEAGTLIDESCDLPDIVATLIDLAARGWITIEEIEGGKISFLSDRDYKFTRNPPPKNEVLKPYEAEFLTGLFPGDNKVTELSSQKNKFYRHLESIKQSIYDTLTTRKYFAHDPNSVRTKWAAAGVIVIFLGIILSAVVGGAVSYGIGTIVAGVILLCSAQAMPAKTSLGTRKLIELLSFKRFVSMVEKDRIKTMAMTDPTIFGRLLPYAMVLGVADQWAEAFADLMVAPPDWYRTHDRRPFHSRMFITDLGAGMRTMQKTFTSQPASKAGSGGSGFSGGGSGGGFGGGGGGSW